MQEKKKSGKAYNLLEMVPVCIADHSVKEDGKVDIRIPKFRNEKFARWFIPRRKSLFHTLHLDEQGSVVWLTIDGKKNIGEICCEIENEKVNNITDRVSRFITQLYEAKCIAFLPLNEF